VTPRIVQLLLRAYLSCKPRPEDRQAPLIRTVDRGKTQAVRVLIEHGAELTAHANGRSLPEVVRDKGFAETAGLLEQPGGSACL